jgi:hypothetical protein
MKTHGPSSTRRVRVCARSRRRAAAAAGLLALAACRATEPAPPPRLRVPPIQLTVAHYAGSPLSGVAPAGTAQRVDVAPEHALVVHFEVEYLERMPEGGLAPVASRARLVAGMRGDEPILATSDLATGARVAGGEAARTLFERIPLGEFGRFEPVVALDGALPEAVTSVLSATSSETFDTPDRGSVQKHVEIQVARGRGASAGDVTVALVLEDLAPEKQPQGEPAPPAAPAARKIVRRESIVLEDRPAIDGDALALVFPSPFAGGDGAAFVARIAVANAPSEAAALERHAAMVAGCKRDIEAAEASTAQRAQFVGATEAQRRRLASALAGLQSPDHRRAALVLLGDATEANMCADLALAADDATLDALVANLAQEELESELERGPGPLGWKLERAAIALCAERRSQGPIAADLAGLLVRHTGAVGRSSGGLEDLLATADDMAAMHERLLAENRVYLEDSNLAARVCAFDWLAARNLAPRGFDPFASLAERRAALDAAEQAAAQKPAR